MPYMPSSTGGKRDTQKNVTLTASTLRERNILPEVNRMTPKSGLRQYRPGTFDRYVAYGQRDRKLMLVVRGILKGFKVKCRSENAARNLAYALRMRAPRIESREGARLGLKVRLDGRMVFVYPTRKRVGQSHSTAPEDINCPK